MTGRVYFVGAGPGDPDLLTVRAANLLCSSDAVLYDALVTPEILERIPAGVRRIAVRRSPREKGVKISDIGGLLVKLASGGKTVVRLKSGDPLIFGRLWEEASFLDATGIPYEIVPGITSALSAAAFARIPLTDRRYSSTLAIVTGHESKDKTKMAVNWEKLASTVDTLVVLMGATNISAYSARLLGGGADESAKFTIVCDGSRGNEKIVFTTLGEASRGRCNDFGDLCTVIINLSGAGGVKDSTFRDIETFIAEKTK